MQWFRKYGKRLRKFIDFSRKNILPVVFRNITYILFCVQSYLFFKRFVQSSNISEIFQTCRKIYAYSIGKIIDFSRKNILPIVLEIFPTASCAEFLKFVTVYIFNYGCGCAAWTWPNRTLTSQEKATFSSLNMYTINRTTHTISFTICIYNTRSSNIYMYILRKIKCNKCQVLKPIFTYHVGIYHLVHSIWGFFLRAGNSV